MNLILPAFFLAFSMMVHFSNTARQPFNHIICDTAILKIDNLGEGVLIDTSLHFNNIKEIVNYKNKNDSLFNLHFRSNNKVSAQIKEKADYDNSIRFHKLIYKYFLGCNKNIHENFDFLEFILKTNIYSSEQLLKLFTSFPDKFRKSSRGKMYMAIINRRPDNIGHSVFGAGDMTFESAGGAPIALKKLVDGDHQFYIILFTASWCAPCRYYANVFRRDLDKLDKSHVKVISISIDKSRSQWLKYLKEEKYGWSNYRAMKDWNSEIMNYLHLERVPRYLLINKNGIIIDEQSGYGMKQIIDTIKTSHAF